MSKAQEYSIVSVLAGLWMDPDTTDQKQLQDYLRARAGGASAQQLAHLAEKVPHKTKQYTTRFDFADATVKPDAEGKELGHNTREFIWVRTTWIWSAWDPDTTTPITLKYGPKESLIAEEHTYIAALFGDLRSFLDPLGPVHYRRQTRIAIETQIDYGLIGVVAGGVDASSLDVVVHGYELL